MKVSLKFCRFSLVLLLALTVAFYAAVGVSAENFECPAIMWRGRNYNNSGYITIDYLYQDGSTEPSVTPVTGYHLGIVADCQFQNNTSYVFAFTVNSNTSEIWYSDYYSILQLHSGEVSRIYQDTTNNYFDRATFYTTGFEDGNITYIVTFNTNGDELAYTYNKIYFAWVTQLSGTSSYDYSFNSVTCYASYDPEAANLTDIQNSITNIINQSNTNTTNIINKLEEVIQSKNSSNSDIQESLDNIITNQETQNEYWEQIINYGNTYNQIDQTIINNLGSAEDQLSSAEGALEDKSKSLMQQASAGISKATTASQTLVTSLTTTIPTVYTFASDIIEVTPPEVQAAVLAIPLLSFAVWLIGLRR